MDENLMDFSMEQDENAPPYNNNPPLCQTPHVVNSILKKSNKDNLIQLFTPVHKPSLKVQFQTPHSTVKKSTPTRFDAVRKLDETERWIERTSVVTKQDHLDYVQYATGFLNELIDNIPLDSTPKEDKEKPNDGPLDSTLTDNMDISMINVENIETPVSSHENPQIPDQTETEEVRDEEEMETDEFFDAVDTQNDTEGSQNDRASESKNITGENKQDENSIQCYSPKMNLAEQSTELDSEHVQQEVCLNHGSFEEQLDKTTDKPVENKVLSEACEPVTEAPSSPPLPAKGSYALDFEHLDDINPFQTKSAVANSPVGSSNNNKEVLLKNEDCGQLSNNQGEGKSLDKTELKLQSPIKDQGNGFKDNIVEGKEIANHVKDLISEAPSSPQLPAKGSYALDFDHLDDINPFQTKSAVVNSPVGSSNEESIDIKMSPPPSSFTPQGIITSPEKNSRLSGLQKVADNPFLQLIDSPAVKEKEFEKQKTQIFKDFVEDGKDDVMSQSFEDIDPFTTKSKIENSPAVNSKTMTGENDATATTTDTDLDEVINAADESFSKIIQEADVVLKTDLSEESLPFKTKSKVINSPVLESNSDPFACRQQLANSPFTSDKTSATSRQIRHEEISETNPASEKLNTCDNKEETETTDPFTSKSKVQNSPLSNSACHSENQSSPISSPKENKETTEDIDPFKPRITIMNSPDIAQKVLHHTGENLSCVIDVDPFKSSNKIMNTPTKEDLVTETLKMTDAANFDPANQDSLMSTNAVQDSAASSDPFQTPTQKTDTTNTTQNNEKEAHLQGDTSLDVFTNPAILGLSEDDFKPSSEDCVLDPSALDFLETIGGGSNDTAESKFSRMSLFLKFDPLVDLPLSDPRRASIAARRASMRDPRLAASKCSDNSIPEESICLMGTPTGERVRRQNALLRNKDASPMFKTPKAGTPKQPNVNSAKQKSKFVDLLTDTPEGKEPQSVLPLVVNMAEERTEDLLEIEQYTEADLRNLKHKMSMEFQGIILLKEKEWHKKMEDEKENYNKALKKQQASHTKEIEAVQKELETTKGRYTSVSKDLKELQATVQAYEVLIHEFAENEEKKKQEIKTLTAEYKTFKEQSYEDMQNLDKAFTDLHKRFNKQKEVLEHTKQNESILKQQLNESDVKLKKSEEKYNSMKQKAEDKIVEICQKIEKLKTGTEGEIAKLQAAMKRKDMQLESLQTQIDQKSKENKELTELCDQLIAQVGGSRG